MTQLSSCTGCPDFPKDAVVCVYTQVYREVNKVSLPVHYSNISNLPWLYKNEVRGAGQKWWVLVMPLF